MKSEDLIFVNCKQNCNINRISLKLKNFIFSNCLLRSKLISDPADTIMNHQEFSEVSTWNFQRWCSDGTSDDEVSYLSGVNFKINIVVNA